MVRLPILTALRVTDYGLFPGDPPDSGITWSFQPGLSLIAGINGLGKTTLLTMILRSLTGPYDLTTEGVTQSLRVILPESPVRLSQHRIGFFRQRVADGARKAKVTLSTNIGDTAVTISRRLSDLYLEGLTINGKPAELPQRAIAREDEFQGKLTELIGLSSFVDVLLVLHHVILFHENRPGALWDPNAQRQLLRALCLNDTDAARVVALERELQSADSQARNIHARSSAMEKQRDKALEREAGEQGVLAKLQAEQKLLDAELEERQRLQALRERLDEERKRARLAHERAKREREDSAGAIERLKYAALLRHFPSMEDTTRLVMSRIMSDGQCLACNAPANEKRAELEDQIARGCCPICGAEPEVQDNVIGPHEFDQAKRERELERAKLAKREEEKTLQQLHDSVTDYDETLNQLEKITASIEERKRKEKRLRAELPDTTTSREYENVLNTLRNELREWEVRRATHLRNLRSLLNERKESMTGKSNELVETFAKLIQTLLVERVRLAQVEAEPRYMQAPGQPEDRVQVPAYAAEMMATDRPGFLRRRDPSDVSESQRELIDLAFRLALVEVFGGSCTFVMETPEASLDGVAMDRVGHALAAFSTKGNNRLVVTSNLTNAGIIGALFDGSASEVQVESRATRVLNLLQVAAPNRALVADRERYDALLENAISGIIS